MRRLWVRVVLAMLLSTWLALAGGVLFLGEAVADSFAGYVNRRDVAMFGDGYIARLETHYAQSGTWDDVLLPGAGAGERRGVGGAQTFVADASGVIVTATEASWAGRHMDEIGLSQKVSLTNDGELVGYVGQQSPGSLALQEAEDRFADELARGLLLAILLSGLVVLPVGGTLAWSLTRPLLRLTHAVENLTVGSLGRQVAVGGTHEVAALGNAFNTMSRRLADSDAMRQRMSADIAHELRTPITVLRGHLEAMLDGVYPLEMRHIGIAYNQTLHLARLVEDLRLLTLAEAGRLTLDKVPVAAETLLQSTVERFRPLADDAGIVLSYSTEPALSPVRVDNGRIQQVFDNLVNNALQHTHSGGEITLHAAKIDATVCFSISNTGNLDSAHAAHVFDRFWRADESRAEGTGLGLAIVRQLVLLHGGNISVQAGENVTTFTFALPAVLPE